MSTWIDQIADSIVDREISLRAELRTMLGEDVVGELEATPEWRAYRLKEVKAQLQCFDQAKADELYVEAGILSPEEVAASRMHVPAEVEYHHEAYFAADDFVPNCTCTLMFVSAPFGTSDLEVTLEEAANVPLA